tara:strand:+ start:757 stop:1251 length:495 start_codon:yes stop_codon:yes gene_type:complete
MKKNKHKHKKKNNCDLLDKTGPHFVVEEDASKIFKDYLDQTDWKKVPRKKESQSHSTTKAPNKKPLQYKKLDLHSFTLAEARSYVDREISTFIASKDLTINLKIITGKGRHSGVEGPILAREIHVHIKKKWREYIAQIEDSPIDVTINSVPIRGHFHLILKKEP